MISTLEVIKKINNYEKRIGTRAVFESQPIDPKQGQQALDFLRDLIKQSQGDQVSFLDYEQLNQYTKAIGVIDTFNKLPSVEDISSKGGVTYQELQKAVQDWHGKEKYINIPQEFVLKAQNMVKPYIEQIKHLPKDKQEKAMKVLEQFYDPKGLYEKAKQNVLTQVGLLLEATKEKHADMGVMINNIYFDKLSPKQTEYLTTLRNWLNTGIDSKYLFTTDTIENTLQKVLQGRVETLKAQHKAEVTKEADAAKRNEEFQKGKIEELKAARHDAENQLQDTKAENLKKVFQEALGVSDKAQSDFMKVKTLYDESQGLKLPPEPEDFTDMEAKAVAAKNEIGKADKDIQKFFDSLPK